MFRMKTRRIQGEPSWTMQTPEISAALRVEGGHLGPVDFHFGRRTISPFSVAPWHDEPSRKDLPPVIRGLRGDFFCLPFGGNASPWRGERHPIHGETANEAWTFRQLRQEAGGLMLETELNTAIRPGRVVKQISLKPGQHAVYSRHLLSRFSGPMNFGHHAMLQFPESGGAVSTSPICCGQVFPGEFESAAGGGYSSLKAGALFKSLSRVPLAAGGWADLSHYPAREGFEDLVMVSSRPGRDSFAWTAVAFPSERYVWFALKDPRVLPSTVLWHSNGGRHYSPWSGRHRRVLGLEEVAAYFHYGLAESVAPNPVSQRGIATNHRLHPKKVFAVNYIMAVAEITPKFDRVRRITACPGGVQLTAFSGSVCQVPLDPAFLFQTASIP